MSDYVVTPRAQADLAGIYNYSVEKWGEAQAVRYIETLISRFAWLARHPTLGRSRDEIASGHRSFPEGEHIVFYVRDADDIYIIGVPHSGMDLAAFFEQDND